MKHLFTCLMFFLLSIQAFSQKDDSYELLINDLVEQGKQDQILQVLLEKEKSNPKDVELLRWIGYFYIEKNELNKAEAYYKKAVGLDLNCSRCYMNLGRIWALRSVEDEALKNLNTAIALNPTDSSAYLLRAQVKQYFGKGIMALSDFDEAIDLAPKNAQYRIERAKCNASLNLLPAAQRDYNKAIELEPENYLHYFERSNYYYTINDLKGSLSDIQKAIQLAPETGKLYNALGAVYMRMERPNDAFDAYSRSIDLSPENYLPYINRSDLNYQREDMEASCRDLDSAIQLIRRTQEGLNDLNYAEERFISFCDPETEGYYIQRGIAFYNLGKFEKSISWYDEGLKKFPENSMMHSFRGNSLFQLQRFDEAKEEYIFATSHHGNLEQEMMINPMYTSISKDSLKLYRWGFVAGNYQSLAEILLIQGNTTEALQMINEGLEMAPNLKDFPIDFMYNVRGNVFLVLGENKKALDDFNAAIDRNSRSALFYVNRAIAKFNLSTEQQTRSYQIRGEINSPNFYAQTSLPQKKIKKPGNQITEALMDCNKAIDLDPELGYAYLIRGQLKIILGSGDHCMDLFTAKNLGMEVEEEVLKKCSGEK